MNFGDSINHFGEVVQCVTIPSLAAMGRKNQLYEGNVLFKFHNFFTVCPRVPHIFNDPGVLARLPFKAFDPDALLAFAVYKMTMNPFFHLITISSDFTGKSS